MAFRVLEKDPSTYSYLTYFWVAGLAALGGVISHFKRIDGGTAWSWRRFIQDVVTSAFVGVLTFWLCEAAELQPLLTAALVGVSGHMGSRTLFIIERALRNK